MALGYYGGPSKTLTPVQGPTEFEILKASHKFLREDEDDEKDSSWEDKLASKYYSSLYREFAVCDLKHYKSGNFALRWRTEAEVLSGAGETTCGNTRCVHHDPRDNYKTSLTTLELPFTYSEHEETKSALVKAVLCKKCLDKMMWKRRKERTEKAGDSEDKSQRRSDDVAEDKRHRHKRHRDVNEGSKQQRRRSSRSLSPMGRNPT
ncbi:folate-sensitive fragile site protein Fra10Ac1-domain-containing protein [Armillaria novae-zelandiae]|uniref:Folate-sensitive fragile site protein Fra10Ac1-domain-containing protein n=1 Tax=Armillaria novae-zelandiae TaxID=153914 RepID=A0AA39P9P6_9AGAR|nr:folate-sensitive fragile site protein Fra10Ac1-domain-containing protein [Armillaria novae-zelandiae]